MIAHMELFESTPDPSGVNAIENPFDFHFNEEERIKEEERRADEGRRRFGTVDGITTLNDRQLLYGAIQGGIDPRTVELELVRRLNDATRMLHAQAEETRKAAEETRKASERADRLIAWLTAVLVVLTVVLVVLTFVLVIDG
jgi:hypothetical protein